MNPESIYYNPYSNHVWKSYWLLNGHLYKVTRNEVKSVEEERDDILDEIEDEYLLNLNSPYPNNPNLQRALQLLANY
jgi:hypothetical protein